MEPSSLSRTRFFFLSLFRHPLSLLFISGIVLACSGPAARIASVKPYVSPAPVAEKDLFYRHGIPPEAVGYLLEDLDTGEVLGSRQPDQAFIPASTVKILTMAAALEFLGPEYRFETSLWITGRVSAGTLEGDLHLRGGGDPLLYVNDLLVLAEGLSALGISRVAGGFFYDETFLPMAPQIDSAQPEDVRYNPGISALSLDFNRQRLTWRSDGDGSSVTAFRTPSVNGTAAGLAEALSASGRSVVWDGTTWLLAPDAPLEGSFFLPVKDPGRFTADVFRSMARMAGAELPGPVAGAVGAGAKPVARVTGRPLIQVAREILSFSNNLAAELAGLTAACRLDAGISSPGDGAEVLFGWLGERISGTDWNGFRSENLSGLSAKARITPRQMISVLRHAESRNYDGRRFHTLLPAAGLSGTLKDRFLAPDTAMRVWAKTGTMSYAKGLAGILFTHGGLRLLFALYITDFSARQDYDAHGNNPDPQAERAADSWITRAEALEEALVRHWALFF